MIYQHEDHCTLYKHKEDRPYLVWAERGAGFLDVNMRLFHSSEGYRHVVLAACAYIRWSATTTKEGYKAPHGFSGANAGIPWNIIALANGTVMINPHISIADGVGVRTSLSNCGSLMFDKPIEITRWDRILVTYFSMEGERCEQTGYLPTVQHEVDHNLGILITDRKVKK